MMNHNVQAHAPHGQQMPRGWQQQAPLRAQQATSDYLSKLENAWRQPLTKNNDSESMQARLRPTGDSRADALRLVADDDDEQIWQEPGATVRIRKRG